MRGVKHRPRRVRREGELAQLWQVVHHDLDKVAHFIFTHDKEVGFQYVLKGCCVTSM